MLTLALETSTSLGSIALGSGGTLVAECALGVRATHSETVLDEVDRLLRRAGKRTDEIGRVVVGSGPGSFTGVRIAASLAKGLCHALGLPLYAYSSLRAVAASVAVSPVCALFDARRDEVYAAAWPEGALGEPLFPPAVEPLGRALGRLDPVASWSFAGEGATRHRAEIEALGGVVLPAHLGVPRAAALLWLADALPAGRVPDPRDWEPGYVRASGAERTLADA